MTDDSTPTTTTQRLTYDFQDMDRGKRLDQVLAREFPALSRTRLKGLIATGKLLIDGRVVEFPAYKVKAKDLAVALGVPQAKSLDLVPQDIALDIVHEDDQLVVVNKPAGLVVHPGAGQADGTLVNALLFHCGESLRGIGGVQRPGIVHRIDKETSGLIVAAKTEAAHAGLAAQFADHSIERTYTAFVWGIPSPRDGRVETRLGRDPHNRQRQSVLEDHNPNGRHAVTHFTTMHALGLAAAKVQCRLETGRTHQIRVHMAHIGHSLVGDPLYGRVTRARRDSLSPQHKERVLSFPRQALHATTLGFVHPTSGEQLSFTSELPSDLVDLEAQLTAT